MQPTIAPLRMSTMPRVARIITEGRITRIAQLVPPSVVLTSTREVMIRSSVCLSRARRSSGATSNKSSANSRRARAILSCKISPPRRIAKTNAPTRWRKSISSSVRPISLLFRPTIASTKNCPSAEILVSESRASDNGATPLALVNRVRPSADPRTTSRSSA